VLAEPGDGERPRPGRIFEEITPICRARATASPPPSISSKRRVLAALDRSLDRPAEAGEDEHKAAPGAALWW